MRLWSLINRAHRKGLWAPLVCMVFAGCAATSVAPPNVDPLADNVALATGVPLFGEPVSKAALAGFAEPEQVLELTPEMITFVEKTIRQSTPTTERARRLVRLLIRKDFFPQGYYTGDTRTAAEVFAERSGNCLSYTSLFVAMARQLGLDARFQLAKIPATWSSENGYLVRSRHINVLIRDLKLTRDDWLTIDFNQVATSSVYPHQQVSDEFALSSFYNNLAVEAMYQKDYRAAVSLLAQAIELDPTNGDSWVNLAAIYSRHDKLAATQQAYEAALLAEPEHSSALGGLVRVLRARGETKRAKELAQELRLRRDRNPYFHFAMANAAYEQEDLKQSREHLESAIALRDNIGAFYYLKALIDYAQGNLQDSQNNLLLARTKRSLPERKRQHAELLSARIERQAGVIPVLVD